MQTLRPMDDCLEEIKSEAFVKQFTADTAREFYQQAWSCSCVDHLWQHITKDNVNCFRGLLNSMNEDVSSAILLYLIDLKDTHLGLIEARQLVKRLKGKYVALVADRILWKSFP